MFGFEEAYFSSHIPFISPFNPEKWTYSLTDFWQNCGLFIGDNNINMSVCLLGYVCMTEREADGKVCPCFVCAGKKYLV